MKQQITFKITPTHIEVDSFWRISYIIVPKKRCIIKIMSRLIFLGTLLWLLKQKVYRTPKYLELIASNY